MLSRHTFPRARFAVVGLAVAALPVGIAATGSAEPSSNAASSSAAASTGSPTPTSSGAAASGASSSSAANGSEHVDKPIALRIAGKNVDPASVPDVGDVFTRGELAPLIPKLTGVDASDDAVKLTISGEASDNRSRLAVDLPHVGAWKDVEAAWKSDKALHEKRAASNPGLYTFFGSGAHGVSDSFTDGTSTYVLVHTGDAAATIRFSGIGFSTLADSHEASRRTYTTRIVPALVDLIGAKTREGAAKQASSSSTSATSPAPSGTGSGSAAPTGSPQSAAPSSSSTS